MSVSVGGACFSGRGLCGGVTRRGRGLFPLATTEAKGGGWPQGAGLCPGGAGRCQGGAEPDPTPSRPPAAGGGGGRGQPAASGGAGVVAGHERLGAGAHGHHAAGRAGGGRLPAGRQRQGAGPLPGRPPEPGWGARPPATPHTPAPNTHHPPACSHWGHWAEIVVWGGWEPWGGTTHSLGPTWDPHPTFGILTPPSGLSPHPWDPPAPGIPLGTPATPLGPPPCSWDPPGSPHPTLGTLIPPSGLPPSP